jgi:hypothetical protein
MVSEDDLFAQTPDDDDDHRRDDPGDSGKGDASPDGDSHPDPIIHWRNARGVFVPTPGR